MSAAMWLPCGSLELHRDGSAEPSEWKAMFSLSGAQVEKSKKWCLDEVVDQVRWPTHPLPYSQFGVFQVVKCFLWVWSPPSA